MENSNLKNLQLLTFTGKRSGSAGTEDDAVVVGMEKIKYSRHVEKNYLSNSIKWLLEMERAVLAQSPWLDQTLVQVPHSNFSHLLD